MFGRKHHTEVSREFDCWKFRCSCGAYASGGSKSEAEMKADMHARQYTKVR